MYGPTDLKKNTLITLDGQPFKVVEYSQKVMGRGGSIVNVKVKNNDFLHVLSPLLSRTNHKIKKLYPTKSNLYIISH